MIKASSLVGKGQKRGQTKGEKADRFIAGTKRFFKKRGVERLVSFVGSFQEKDEPSRFDHDWNLLSGT